MSKIKVFLGDLVHDSLGAGTWMVPLNIGYLAAYTNKVLPNEAGIKLFKFPGKMIRAIRRHRPDIVGLSFYEWNKNLSEFVAGIAREANPECVVVYGGPSITNLSLKPEILEGYFAKYTQPDFYVYNQGEKGFVNILQSYIKSGRNTDSMFEKPIEGVISLNRNGRLGVDIGPPARPFAGLDEIPSPYLTGLLDLFFGKKMIPLLESHRGCPYRCGFCAWGISTAKIQKFNTDRVKEELDYISRRAGEDFTTIQLADGNFGIFERDIEIAGHVRGIYEKKGLPRNFVAAWAKESDDRVLRIAQRLGNICSISMSFQSMNPDSLRIAGRKNLRLPRARELLAEYNKSGIRTCSELILGLPEETPETHIQANETLMRMGVRQIFNYNLHLLNGTLLASDEIRNQYFKKTKYRIQDGGFGEYEGTRIIEEQEIVVETTTLSARDILYFRILHWLIQFCYSTGYYAEILKFFELTDIGPLSYLDRLIRHAGRGGDRVSAVFKDFRRVAREELRAGPEALWRYWRGDANYRLLSRGDHGKLNFQYTFRVLLECKQEFEDYMKKTAFALTREKKVYNRNLGNAIEDLFLFMGNRSIDFKDGEFKTEREFEFRFDILRWKKDGYKKDLLAYATTDKRPLIFSLPPGQIRNLKFLLNKYKSPNLNLTIRKMSEYININELFYKVAGPASV